MLVLVNLTFYSLSSINHWANEFGAIISGVVSRATGEVEIRSVSITQEKQQYGPIRMYTSKELVHRDE